MGGRWRGEARRGVRPGPRAAVFILTLSTWICNPTASPWEYCLNREVQHALKFFRAVTQFTRSMVQFPSFAPDSQWQVTKWWHQSGNWGTSEKERTCLLNLRKDPSFPLYTAVRDGGSFSRMRGGGW